MPIGVLSSYNDIPQINYNFTEEISTKLFTMA